MKETIKKIEEQHNVNVVYLTLSGSKLYGTNSENSDTDYKGIFIPNVNDVLLRKDPKSISFTTGEKDSKNSKDDIDFTLHNVVDFFNMLKKSETGSMDLLFSMFRNKTIVFEDSNFTDLIKKNYKNFLNTNMKSFIGYALGQTKKFGIKGARYDELDSFVKSFENSYKVSSSEKIGNIFDELADFICDYNYIKFVTAPGPKANRVQEDIKYISVLGKLFSGDVTIEYFFDRINNLYRQFGNRTKTIAKTEAKTDFKALSHAYRVAIEVKELLETNFIKFPLKDSEYIKAIKSGKVSLEAVVDQVQDILEDIDNLLLTSSLPEKPNSKELDKLLLGILKSDL